MTQTCTVNSADMSLTPGTRLGPFEILAPLGAGGMGEVYKATDTRLGRTVAIKLSREEFSERFEREARAVAALNHPHICQLYDIGPNYLVMEFVDGTPLRRPEDAGQLVGLASQIADALVAAHAAGIVHRDLKPDNILVTEDGQVKVLDFGLATGGLGGSAEALVTQMATAAGTTVGTVAYMSPEQARGEPVDARSDLWSLGVILYELATGARPFGGATTAVVFDQILNQPAPALPAGSAGVPAGWSSIVAKLLEKDRARRYGSAADLRAALQALVSGTAPAVREAPSIAVLPFANMSADAENEYFCDGIAEEITSALARVAQLRIAGRTSAFSFKGKTGDLREIGHTLNVGTVLEGSVRKAGNRLRITAQLINVADGYQLWSARYDRQLEDIFDIQDEIALAVVEALKVTLLGREKDAVLKHATGNPEAYRLCLQARHVWQRWTDEGFRSAIALFNEAIAADSQNAVAHTGLADCYLAWSVLGRHPWDLPKIRTAFETALRLNPDAGPPHAVYGAIVYGVMLWDWPRAEAECRRAAELAPRDGHVWSCYGILMSAMGRHEEAITMHRRAVELDPVSPFWNAWLIAGLLPTRDWAEARRETERTLATLPEYWLALMFAGQAHGACGRWDEAVATFERAVRSSGEVPYAIGLLGHALARAGRQDEARQRLAQLHERAESHYVPASAMAFVHAGLYERDEAFALLGRALDVYDHWAVFALTNLPVLDDLRPDPRFAALRRRMGLTSP